MSASVRYSFESQPTRRTLEQAADMLKKLLLRLGVKESDVGRLTPGDRRVLTAFTSACHLNIEWYDRSRKQQRRWYWAFVVVTALVVVGMPVAVFLAYAEMSDALTAQIGVIITGVLGAHRLLASSFEKRNLAHHFWKAQADLKSILYSLEDKWRTRALGANAPETLPEGAYLSFAPGFLDDVADGTRKSQGIKAEEQELFFARGESMFSNISELMGTTFKQTGAAADAIAQSRRERTQASATLDELEVVYEVMGGQIRTLEGELAELDRPGATASPATEARRQGIVATLDDLRRRRLNHELTLVAARAKLDQS